MRRPMTRGACVIEDRWRIEAARREGYQQAQKEHAAEERRKEEWAEQDRELRNQLLYMFGMLLAGILLGASLVHRALT